MRNKLFTTTFLATRALIAMPKTFEEGGQTFDFPDTVEDINVVPEKARGLYTREGDTGPFKFTDVGGLKNSLQNARNERDSARKTAAAITKWEKLGKTPEEIETLLEGQRTAEEQKLKDEGDFKTLKEQMEANHKTALDDKDKRINKLVATLEKETIEAGLLRAMSDKDVEGNPLFLLPAMRGRVKLDETDEGFTTVVLREDGTPLLNKENKPATLKDLALEFKGKDEWAAAFKGVGQSGGGASGGGGGGGGAGGTKKRSEMNPSERVSYIREHGQAEYMKLPE